MKKEPPRSEDAKHETDDQGTKDEESTAETGESSENTRKKDRKNKDVHSSKNALSKAEQRKLYKLKKRQKRSRIVIRNLPFTITAEQLKEHFSKYGNIEEIKLMKRPDGKPTGCCFLQFDRVQSAAQSIHHENLKTPFGRAMVVDWAIAKDKYAKLSEEGDVKVENSEDDDLSVVKDETNKGEVKIKEEEDSDEEGIKQEDEDEDSEDDGNSEADDDEDQSEDDRKKALKREADLESVISSSSSHPKRVSNDVSEGKTVFIKNVPFTAKNEDLKQCMEQFGPVYYALICMDRLTEHSKGTAFVKFTVRSCELVENIGAIVVR